MDPVPPTNYLQAVDIAQQLVLADRAGISALIYTAGGGIVFSAFLIDISINVWRTYTGQRAQWPNVVLKFLFFFIVLLSYRQVAGSIADIVTSFGTLDSTEHSVTAAARSIDLLKERATSFSGYMKEAMEKDAGFAQTLINDLVAKGMALFTWLSYLAVAAIVQMIKVVQRCALNFLIYIGPILIAFSAFPGPTSKWGVSWLMTYIEVLAWGVTSKILVILLGASFAKSNATSAIGNLPALAEHIAFNTTYLLCFLSVPLITSTVIRGGSAGDLGQKGIMAKVGTAVAVVTAAYQGGKSAVSSKNDDGAQGGGGQQGRSRGQQKGSNDRQRAKNRTSGRSHSMPGDS